MYTQNQFKKLIADKHTTQEAVACILGIDRSTLYRKLKGGITQLTLGEAKKITDFLGLSEMEAARIFWGQ